MKIKDEMKGKKEEKKKIKKIVTKDKMINNLNETVTELSKENKELKDCMKDKDKRITKIEERLTIVKDIGGVLGLLGFAGLFVYCFYLILSNDYEGFMWAMSGLGVFVLTWCIISFFIFIVLLILNGLEDDLWEQLSFALFFGFVATIIFVVIVYITTVTQDSDLITNMTEAIIINSPIPIGVKMII